MVPSTLRSFVDIASRLRAVFELSKQNLQLGFASIQLHDAVFRLKLLEEDLISYQDGLARLKRDEVDLVDTLRLHFDRVERILD
jgi:hypothetical protein